MWDFRVEVEYNILYKINTESLFFAVTLQSSRSWLELLCFFSGPEETDKALQRATYVFIAHFMGG